jgi:hypothetical protein
VTEFITPKPGPNYVCDVCDRGSIPALGPLPIHDEDGEHVGLQCSAQSLLRAGHGDGEQYAVIFLSNCVEPSAKGLGFYMAMNAANARELAASLIETADQIDGGKGKQ